MLAELLSDAGWDRGTLQRVGVGVGPGSFTGLRVGIALAQGIAMGLAIPVVGVGSLRCMARAVRPDLACLRWAMLDARRSELFCAVYDQSGTEVVRPITLPRDAALARLAKLCPTDQHVVVGEVASELGAYPVERSEETDLPHAHWAAVLAGETVGDEASVEPAYVREPDAVLPNLPPHPLAKERES